MTNADKKDRLIKHFLLGTSFDRDMAFSITAAGLEGTTIETLRVRDVRRADGLPIDGQPALISEMRDISISPLARDANKAGLVDTRFGIGRWEGGGNTDLFSFISGYTKNAPFSGIPDNTEVVCVNPVMMWPPKAGIERGFSTLAYWDRFRAAATQGNDYALHLFSRQERQGYNVILPHHDAPLRPVAYKYGSDPDLDKLVL